MTADLRAAILAGLSTTSAAAAADGLPAHPRSVVLAALCDVETATERALLLAGSDPWAVPPVARSVVGAAAGPPYDGSAAELRAALAALDVTAALQVAHELPDPVGRAVCRALGDAARALERARAVVDPPAPMGQAELPLGEKS